MQGNGPLAEALRTRLQTTLAATPVQRADGEFVVQDQSLGLFSRPGYDNRLADQIAIALDGALQDTFTR